MPVPMVMDIYLCIIAKAMPIVPIVIAMAMGMAIAEATAIVMGMAIAEATAWL